MNDLSRMDPSDLAAAWQRDERPAEPAEVCPRCEGFENIGVMILADGRTFKPIPCPVCAAHKTAGKRRRQSGLTILTDKTFSGFQCLPGTEYAFERCRDYAVTPSGWLFLTGGVGRGKSHLAAAIGNAVLARGGEVVFETVPDLLDQLRATYGNDQDETYTERFARFRDADLLILDDLGTETSAKEWAREKIFQIINHRYNTGAPTVVTTNKALSALDERIESRLGDQALVERIDFSGAGDYRKIGVSRRRAA